MTVRVLVLAVAFAMAACSCASNSTATSPTAPSTPTCNGVAAQGTMTATVDGAVWTAGCLTDLPWRGTSIGPAGMVFEVYGSDGKQSIGVQAAVTGPGTYSIGSSDGAASAFVNAPGAVNMIPTVASAWNAGIPWGGTGTITVTQVSTAGAIGTFSFTAVPNGPGATGNKVVTSGAFNITF